MTDTATPKVSTRFKVLWTLWMAGGGIAGEQLIETRPWCRCSTGVGSVALGWEELAAGG